MQTLKLNIGCGLTAPSGWVNMDSSLNARLAKWPWFRKMLAALRIIPLAKVNIPYPGNIFFYDVRKGLPFLDDSVEIIYSSHFLEHLSKLDVLFFMKECYRVLIRGGIVRILVPDLALSAGQYIEKLERGNKEDLIKSSPSEEFLNALGILDIGLVNENIFLRLYKRIMGDKNTHKWMYDEYSLTSLLKREGFSNIQRKQAYESLIKDIEKIDNAARFNNAVCLEAQKL